jgi:hypothetical protein
VEAKLTEAEYGAIGWVTRGLDFFLPRRTRAALTLTSAVSPPPWCAVLFAIPQTPFLTRYARVSLYAAHLMDGLPLSARSLPHSERLRNTPIWLPRQCYQAKNIH